ncbi:MAG: hypothetical protein EZS28_005629 [Streblomastix strix]|uniref:Uncharacterized protein n=1 Tax=Streblomastix strix TaxID=222440 RepID=A0A5J4WUV9_9EUKA|nr:MAG: hypothetical protein EZS28_005629 [Streblomastix strix]
MGINSVNKIVVCGKKNIHHIDETVTIRGDYEDLEVQSPAVEIMGTFITAELCLNDCQSLSGYIIMGPIVKPCHFTDEALIDVTEYVNSIPESFIILCTAFEPYLTEVTLFIFKRYLRFSDFVLFQLLLIHATNQKDGEVLQCLLLRNATTTPPLPPFQVTIDNYLTQLSPFIASDLNTSSK